MLVKLFLLSFVFFSMLIDDNHSVQAQNEVLRFCRTTGCDTRTLQEVFDQCRRVYGSNTIRREQCDGGRFRHTCCTRQPRCLDFPCTRSGQAIGEITRICRQEFGEQPLRITGRTCGQSRTQYRCCTRP
ncbi:uncharacterized protein LOC107365124 [Tetranychus urticae]|uniref:uncharacterized protein LOC107365124 n=1 Tax=Tetranychus urticae TaxID=32264 RepID=UPI000D65DB1D|nr:uncharacterized protein LOC107365124 [Tetranychus urticae]